jgi:hypothetical protein
VVYEADAFFSEKAVAIGLLIMEWDEKALIRLYGLFQERHERMKSERRTDRKNLSALWNSYLSTYGVTLLRSDKKEVVVQGEILKTLMDIINHRNELVAEALVIRNPDRPLQYIIVPRESAQKIIVLGMI